MRFAGHELLELVALESARAEAIVVGEDLGTVEEGLREELHHRRILSTKVVWFEDEPPEAWPAQSLAMVTTHDLPTLAGHAPRHRRAAGDARPPRAPRRPARRSDRSTTSTVEVHHRLGRSPAALALATLEDLLEVEERPNLPGTTDDERPNWSVALPVRVDDLPTHPGPAPSSPRSPRRRAGSRRSEPSDRGRPVPRVGVEPTLTAV